MPMVTLNRAVVPICGSRVFVNASLPLEPVASITLTIYFTICNSPCVIDLIGIIGWFMIIGVQACKKEKNRNIFSVKRTMITWPVPLESNLTVNDFFLLTTRKYLRP